MSVIAVPNTFSPNTTISSSQVNANFTTIYNDYNGGISSANLATDSVGSTQIAASAVTTAKINASAVDYTKVATGFVVQIVDTLASGSTSAVATGTTQLPRDDTVPQNTEGDEYMTATITPKATSNILNIQVTALVASSVANHVSGALFQDTTANALAATTARVANINDSIILVLQHRMAAGTTSATTFKFRAGPSSAATVTFNGANTGRVFNTIPKSSLVITEYKA